MSEPQRDNNNNTRPRTSPFRLLAENGSGTACCLLANSNQPIKLIFRNRLLDLNNVNTEKENELSALLDCPESVKPAWRYGIESVDTVMQMALPLFEGEEEPIPQRQLTLPFPGLRQQREDGAFKQTSLATRSAAAPESFCAANREEPKPGLSVSDSELALVDDCSLSELGTSLDSCSIVKQEAGVLCAVTEADLVTPSPKATVASCDNEDFHSFDTRQKLKVHLLHHAEDPRPYQCTVEGCGWAFATSYKLKRHLQSHDKQRPHTCNFEGCGRRFTTVYNLKAHVKVHEHDNSFICEICSERFRSVIKLFFNFHLF
uniref:C2H2-type domain-containing protein n=1 Tax=Lates calcarifer TaxID=8187 RepID=A0A4W6DRP0_LATCA